MFHQQLKVHVFCGNRRFNAIFTRALQWSLFWAKWNQSVPSHPVTHICHPCYTPRPSYPSWFDFSSNIWQGV